MSLIFLQECPDMSGLQGREMGPPYGGKAVLQSVTAIGLEPADKGTRLRPSDFVIRISFVIGYFVIRHWPGNLFRKTRLPGVTV